MSEVPNFAPDDVARMHWENALQAPVRGRCLGRALLLVQHGLARRQRET